jgi:hypothetical protein
MNAVTMIAIVETKRLFQAMEDVRRNKLAAMYGKLTVEDYASLATASTLVETWMPALAKFLEKEGHQILGLKKSDSDDPYIESAWKTRTKSAANSLFSATVKAQYELERANADLLAWLENMRKWLQKGTELRKIITIYADHLESGVQILSGYQPEKEQENWNNKITRLYASVLTWQNEKDLRDFITEFKIYLLQTVDVILSGPVGVLGRLSELEFVIITEIITGHEVKVEGVKAFKWIQDILTTSSKQGTFYYVQLIMKDGVEQYAKSLTDGMTGARGNLKNDDSLKQFLKSYRNGDLFR